jgi:hypothetical protein
MKNMSQSTFNPIVALFRSTQGPERSMTLPAHSDALARHFLRSPDILAQQVALAEYLLPAISTPEQAKEALEWIAARWPADGAMVRNHSGDDIINKDTARAQSRIVDTLAQQGVDLSLPIASPEASAILDRTTLSLGEVLLQLGYTHLSPLVETPKKEDAIHDLAMTCARNGDLENCATWIERSDQTREKTNLDVWLALGREKTTPLDDLHFLPAPPLHGGPHRAMRPRIGTGRHFGSGYCKTTRP